MLFLAHWARTLSWQETAVAFRSTWDKVCQAVEYVVEWGASRSGPIRAISVDEIQYAKGHKYLTLVYQIEQGCIRLLWVGKGTHRQEFRAVLRPHRQVVVRGHRIRLLRHVEAIPTGYPRALRQCIQRAISRQPHAASFRSR
jgi:Transposase